MDNILIGKEPPAHDAMLLELARLEHFSVKYKNELLFVSKKIRNEIWNSANEKILSRVMGAINTLYQIAIDSVGSDNFISLDSVIEYIALLGKYSIYYHDPKLNTEFFNNFIDELRLYSESFIIEEQWKDIYSSEDGMKSFIEIFDDVFTHCFIKHKNRFFHPLVETDILCRGVEATNCNRDRFIPWPSKTHNRWNPPGRQFLYLSFSQKERRFSDNITLNELVSLLELKAKRGVTYSFCNFKALKPGYIFDLSYNDISLSDTRDLIDRSYNETLAENVDYLLNDPVFRQRIANGQRRKLPKSIRSAIMQHPIKKEVLEEAYAKQYLIMVCRCIYKKVDETDEKKREEAFKSFHILAQYLEKKGVTGIIYPCTRTNKIVGKNLVLFNVSDAVPIESTIREYTYNGEGM